MSASGPLNETARAVGRCGKRRPQYQNWINRPICRVTDWRLHLSARTGVLFLYPVGADKIESVMVLDLGDGGVGRLVDPRCSPREVPRMHIVDPLDVDRREPSSSLCGCNASDGLPVDLGRDQRDRSSAPVRSPSFPLPTAAIASRPIGDRRHTMPTLRSWECGRSSLTTNGGPIRAE
jgi:hypothetical protein